MDERRDEWMAIGMDGRTNKQWIDEWMNVNGEMNGQTDRWKDRPTTDGQMD